MCVVYPRAFLQKTVFALLWFLTGAAAGDDRKISYEASVTAIALASSDPRVLTDATGSADLWLHWVRPAGRWTLHVEGNTTPREEGVSTVIGESNADAGTALNEARQGRVQVSELFYTRTWDEARTGVVGMLDPSAYLDVSRIANDANTQFLGVSFVNNPTIEFPDYTLGLVYEQRLASAGLPVLRAVLAASNGLANNPKVSYSQLLNVGNRDKGVFAALRAGWTSPTALLSVGAWTHTAPHTALDDPARTDLRNYGGYVVTGMMRGRHALNLRLGAANPIISRASAFAALSYRYQHDPWTFGAGHAHIVLSNHVTNPALDDTRQSEVFARYQYVHNRYITASVQHIVNSNFDTSGAVYDRAISLLGLRWTLLW